MSDITRDRMAAAAATRVRRMWVSAAKTGLVVGVLVAAFGSSTREGGSFDPGSSLFDLLSFAVDESNFIRLLLVTSAAAGVLSAPLWWRIHKHADYAPRIVSAPATGYGGLRYGSGGAGWFIGSLTVVAIATALLAPRLFGFEDPYNPWGIGLFFIGALISPPAWLLALLVSGIATKAANNWDTGDPGQGIGEGS